MKYALIIPPHTSDTMQDLLIHLFVVIPVLRHIFAQSHWSQGKRILAGVGFLLALAGGTLIAEYYDSRPNLYQIVGVPVSSSAADLKRQFRTLSVKLHPDKNPSPTADTEFLVFREAYEFLSHPTYRSNYDRFGPSAIKTSTKSADDGWSTLITGAAVGALMNYSLWLFLVFLLLSGKDCARGRTWALTALAGMLIFELQMTLNTDFDILSSVLPYWTPYDKMGLVRKVFSALFSSFRVLSQALYVDEEAIESRRLDLILENTRASLSLLVAVQHQLASLKLTKKGAARVAAAAAAAAKAGGAATAATGPASVTEAADSDDDEDGNGALVAEGGHSEALPVLPEVAERLARAQELLGAQGGLREGAPVRRDAPARGKGGAEKERNPIWSIVSYVAVPVVLNFLLNR